MNPFVVAERHVQATVGDLLDFTTALGVADLRAKGRGIDPLVKPEKHIADIDTPGPSPPGQIPPDGFFSIPSRPHNSGHLVSIAELMLSNRELPLQAGSHPEAPVLQLGFEDTLLAIDLPTDRLNLEVFPG